MRRIIPLIGPDFRSQSPKDFYERIKSLYEKPQGASSVEGIKISFGSKVTQVRITRDDRVITKEELKQLAKEHDKPIEEIEQLLTKRKVSIV